MLSFLEKISAKIWESAGTIVGLSACSFIALQLQHEGATEAPSSLSLYHLVGFIFVYLFWFFYGLRFRHVGVWLPNAVATLLQIWLFVYVVLKNAM